MLSPQDIAVIAVVGFFVFGPKKLPEMAKSLGSSIVEFKKAMKGETAEAPKEEAPAEVAAAPQPAAAVQAPPQQIALPAQSQDATRKV